MGKQNDQTTQALLNSNEWSYWLRWDGRSGRDPFTGQSGGRYPNQQVGAIFFDGILWGGIVDDSASPVPLRVGGSMYMTGQEPGAILGSGHAQDPSHPEVAIYRIRSDYAEISSEVLAHDAAAMLNKSRNEVTAADVEALREQYRRDWENWPVHLGAPYTDLNGNGVWDAGVDQPGIRNAIQTLWHVTNDLNGDVTNDFTGAPGMGLEIQHTYWTEDNPALKDVLFRRVRLINKSDFDISEMYLGIWSDVDLGQFGDDLVGCDSTLSLAFVYNGFDEDEEFAAAMLKPAAQVICCCKARLFSEPGEYSTV